VLVKNVMQHMIPVEKSTDSGLEDELRVGSVCSTSCMK
jgi:hypothetical protein